jgi:hypothetical protein
MKRYCRLSSVFVISIALGITGMAQARPSDNVIFVKTHKSYHTHHDRPPKVHHSKGYKTGFCKTRACMEKHPSGQYLKK